MIGDELRRITREILPGLVVVLVAALWLATAIPELDGRLPALLAAGVGCVGIASFALQRVVVEGPSVATLPAPAPRLAPPTVARSRPQPTGPRLSPARVRGIESFTVAKEGICEDENEDAVKIADGAGVVVLSDGASSSFGAAVWSRCLVNTLSHVAGSLTIDALGPHIDQARATWRDHHASNEVPWWAREALERGAFATLLVVRVGSAGGQRRWEACAVGDTCLLQLRPDAGGWSQVCSFPLASADQFGSNPDLVGSLRGDLDGFVVQQGVLERGDRLFAATDAVAEWLLTDPRHARLAATASIDDVRAAVVAARAGNEIVNDDLTFVRIPGGDLA